MAFTYDPTLADTVSQLRNLIQDTVEPSLFQDEELSYLLSVNSNSVIQAGTECLYRLWMSAAHKADVSEVDNVRIEFANQAKNYKMIYEDLKRRSSKEKSGKNLPMYFGGINTSTFDSNREDTTLVKPSFTKDTLSFDPDFPELSQTSES